MAVGVAGLVLSGCGRAAQAPDPDAVPYAGTDELPEKLSEDGTTITVGDAAAPMTVRLYEDMRCPVVEEFEGAGGASVVREMTLSREVKTEYTLASFRDDSQGGDGSKRAVNALRAALDAGKFSEYHAVLIRHRTEAELAGGYTTGYLLELADQVKGLRSKSFDSAVTTMKYRTFVSRSQKAYERANGSADDPLGPGTPTVLINGKQIPEDQAGVIFDKQWFEDLLEAVQYQPLMWKSA
ncbi:thioredoxin domain-containing protein [Streptomyces sp. NPDC058572]|uniref:thioredoxin domain-containing protein n=1 Tax=Streptomyces sp. NPDC058572 TaxID=3346546 RepID=UPI00366885BC